MTCPSSSCARSRCSDAERARARCASARALFTLRTESLRDDWIALLLKTGQPDVYQLPKSNPTQVGPLGPPPVAHFTKEVTETIERVEAVLFTTFGYKKRTPPFEM